MGKEQEEEIEETEDRRRKCTRRDSRIEEPWGHLLCDVTRFLRKNIAGHKVRESRG